MGRSFSLKSFPNIAAIVSLVAALPAVAHGRFNRTDYVIVGGGPAGFVLAEQLSRNPHKNVILLEAGPDGLNSSLINSNFPRL